LRRTSVIAVGELVLEQDKESAEVILHQALRAAADRDADDARGAQDRRRDQDNAQACDRGRAPAREVEIGKNPLD